MRHLLLSILCFCSLNFHLSAQTLLSTTSKTLTAGKTATLDGLYGPNRYQAYDLDVNALLLQARTGASSLNFTLNLGQASYAIAVTENTELFGKDFALTTYQHGQATDITSGLFIQNYRGTLQNDASVPVSLTVSDVGIALSLGLPGGEMELTPTFMPLLGDYEADEYVFHANPESPTTGSCPSGNLIPTNDCTPPGGMLIEQTVLTNNCRRMIEINIDADHLFLDDFPQTPFGTFLAVFSMIVSVEGAEPVFVNDFDMGIQIVGIRLFPTAATDPYPEMNLIGINAGANYMQMVTDIWAGIPQTTVRRDMALLFTGNNCFGNAENIIWGAASDLEAMCNLNAVAMVTQCIFSSDIAEIVIAHEIGHILGAIHTDETNCSGDCDENGAGTNAIMCPGSYPNRDPLFMDACNSTTINNFLTTMGGCLNQDAQIVGPASLCQGQTGTYTFVPNSTPNVNPIFAVHSSLSILNQSGNSITVQANNTFSGLTWIRVLINDPGFMNNCSPSFQRNIAIEGVPATCPQVYRVCPGHSQSNFSLQVPAGWSISNIQCISLNCSDITWGTVASGNDLEFGVSQGQPGFYIFQYNVNTPCGTNTYNFTVQVLPPLLCGNPVNKTTQKEVHPGLALDLWPNPNNGNFTLQYELPDEGRATIAILNLQGQRVFELPASEVQGAGQYTKELNLDHLPLGMYLISLSTGTQHKMTRLVIHE